MQANEILHHKLTLNGYLAEFTGQSMDTITADTDRDFFMSAQEAVRRGGWPGPPQCSAAGVWALQPDAVLQLRSKPAHRWLHFPAHPVGAALYRLPAWPCLAAAAVRRVAFPGRRAPRALSGPQAASVCLAVGPPQVEYGLIDAVVSKPVLAMA